MNRLNLITFAIGCYPMLLAISQASSSGGGEPLKAGAVAPDFTAKTTDDSTIRLKQYAGRNIVVLYFYPEDDTPGCTKEACNFRDNMETLTGKGIVVLGVSMDDAASHRAFTSKYHLNFPLLIDAGERIAGAYGVPVTNGRARRITFLIGKDGVIRKVYTAVDVTKHALDVLEDAKSLGLFG